MNIPCRLCQNGMMPLQPHLQDVVDVFDEHVQPTAKEILDSLPRGTQLTAVHQRLQRLRNLKIIKRVAKTYPAKYDLCQ